MKNLVPADLSSIIIDGQFYPGYYMIGDDTLTCTEDTTFDKAAPSCPPISCGEPSLNPHSSVAFSSGEYTYGHNITYACDTGYDLIGQQTSIFSLNFVN